MHIQINHVILHCSKEQKVIMAKIILITGGQRSGKSSYAEQLALKLSPNPIYLATSRIWDEDFRKRVEIHQARRGSEWTNIEENLYLSNHPLKNRTTLIDCLTLWTTNWYFDHQDWTINQTSSALQQELDKLKLIEDANIILVTNEIGMGGTSANEVQRRFTDLLGWTNQHAAQLADEVIFMVSGIPVKIK